MTVFFLWLDKQCDFTDNPPPIAGKKTSQSVTEDQRGWKRAHTRVKEHIDPGTEGDTE